MISMIILTWFLILSGEQAWSYQQSCDHQGTHYDICPISDPDHIKPSEMGPNDPVIVINPKENNAAVTTTGRFVTTKKNEH